RREFAAIDRRAVAGFASKQIGADHTHLSRRGHWFSPVVLWIIRRDTVVDRNAVIACNRIPNGIFDAISTGQHGCSPKNRLRNSAEDAANVALVGGPPQFARLISLGY